MYFPNLFKHTRVVPIFKTNHALLLNSYRPILLHSVFSKIFEKKKFFKHISRYLTLKKNICEQQCGFINGTSTDISVAKLLKHVDDGLDANKFGTCVFLGNCKAFDMVNKGILFSKLFTYGIRGLAYQLLCSYLENQQQYVTIISTGSSTSPIGMGVPQGSNLGTYYF